MKKIALYCFILLSLWACNKPADTNKIQEGDILFQQLECGELCDAINKVTDGYQGKDYAHCGLVVSVNDTLRVIEAIGSKVQLTLLPDFARRSNDTVQLTRILVGRVKPEYRNLIPAAAQQSLKYIGIPYDDVFEMDNGKMYCSEVLYEAFKTANANKDFFNLNPMTFKDPETQTTFKAWEDYYKALNYPVPEGKPGLNPGGISLSDKIEIIAVKRIE